MSGLLIRIASDPGRQVTYHPPYLSMDREYRAEHIHDNVYRIEDDCFQRCYVKLTDCPHLRGGKWEIVQNIEGE